MTASLTQAQTYAKLKKTKVFETPGGYKISNDHKSITFVLESGSKLTMTGEELEDAIAEMQGAAAKEAAHLDIDDQPKTKSKKEKPPAE